MLESLSRESARLKGWIEQDCRHRRPWLCGFSNGAAMAASLLQSDPSAYSGLIMLAACFPVGEDSLDEGALGDVPVLFCNGTDDTVIPARNFEEAERYLSGSSGAKAAFLRYEGGHEPPLVAWRDILSWLEAQEATG